MNIAIQNRTTFPNRLIAPHLRNLLVYQNQVAAAWYDKYDTSATRVRSASQIVFAHPFKTLPTSWWKVLIMNDDDPDVLGLHFYDVVPTARMAMGTIRALGAEPSDQAEILITAMSHEIAEMTANPGAERVVARTFGGIRRRWTREICDPVNAIAYPVTRHGVTSYVSDWVKPGWFGSTNGAWDVAGEITKHHQILADGYMSYLLDNDTEHIQEGPYDQS
jgi:hypothetical protein